VAGHGLNVLNISGDMAVKKPKKEEDRGTEGERAIKWIQKHCRVPEGSDVGKPVVLREWQKKILTDIYDNPDGTRRAIISFARKNGKTALVAFILLLHLIGPRSKQNSHIYSAAQSRDQAAIIFGLAAKVVRLNPALSEHIIIRDSRKELVCPPRGTHYQALSAEVATSFGLSPSLIVHDELGQVCRREQLRHRKTIGFSLHA
jgi:phage terminase large subunit-like protein